MKKSNLKARKDRQVSCLGIVEFHLPVYIQVEIGFTGQGSREPSGWAVVSTQEPPNHRTGCSQRENSGSVSSAKHGDLGGSKTFHWWRRGGEESYVERKGGKPEVCCFRNRGGIEMQDEERWITHSREG